MTDRDPRREDESNDNDAPELHNDEQDDEDEQAQSVAEEALDGEAREHSPLDSEKVHGGIDDSDGAQDLIDRMRDMEQSGRIDMGAYRGEPNLDDDEDKYGEANKERDRSGDEGDDASYAGPDDDDEDDD